MQIQLNEMQMQVKDLTSEQRNNSQTLMCGCCNSSITKTTSTNTHIHTVDANTLRLHVR